MSAEITKMCISYINLLLHRVRRTIYFPFSECFHLFPLCLLCIQPTSCDRVKCFLKFAKICLKGCVGFDIFYCCFFSSFQLIALYMSSFISSTWTCFSAYIVTYFNVVEMVYKTRQFQWQLVDLINL